jgi:lysozyme family protein
MDVSDRLRKALPFTLKIEGGFSDDPSDHGGATNKGVTLKELQQLSATVHGWDFDKDHDGDVDVEDLKQLSDDDVCAVMVEGGYWKPQFDQLRNDVIAIKTFDFGFNCGTKSGIRLLQQAINGCGTSHVDEDGNIGPRTVIAANGCDQVLLLKSLIIVAQEHYRAIVAHDPTQQKWLKGWLNRAQSIPNI